MTHHRSAVLLATLLLGALLQACTTAPRDRPEAVAEQQELTVSEQNEMALEEFKEMLELTASVPRSTILDDLKKRYYTIVNDYPRSDLAQESYWRLILMNLEDYYPPRVDEAEELYREYFERYEQPRLNNAINDTMVRFYARHQMWEKVIDVALPYMKAYAERGDLPNPVFMFFYSEAHGALGDLAEAARGYRIIIQRFPGSRDAEISQQRLEKIANMR